MNEATKLADRLVKLEIVNVYLGDYFVGDEYISDSAERVINDGLDSVSVQKMPNGRWSAAVWLNGPWFVGNTFCEAVLKAGCDALEAKP